MTLAFVAIGSNLGDRLLNIAEARRRLDLLGARTSGPIIETDAVLAPGDRFPQPRYLNTVDAIETRLSLDGFFAALRSAEVQMGRQRSERWAPRNIDLDLLLFGDETRATEELTLPHPRMHERDFVMRPLRAVAAQLPLPRRYSTSRMISVLVRVSTDTLPRELSVAFTCAAMSAALA